MQAHELHKRSWTLYAGRLNRLRLLALTLSLAIALLVGLWLPLAASRAEEPTFPGRIAFGEKGDHTLAVATGDLDGDGDLDVAAGGDERSAVYLNDGLGNLRETKTKTLAPGIRDLAVGDLDGDGDLDIAVTGASGAAIYRNLGGEKFEAERISSVAEPMLSLALGDMNGDGSFDLILGNDIGPTLVYTNDGSAKFLADAVKIGAEISRTFSLAVGHLDDDGCLDVVAGHGGGASVAYLSQHDDGHCDLQFTSVPFGVAVTDTRKVVLGDFDGDDALDIVALAGVPYGVEAEPFRLFRNDRQGHFSDDRSRSFGRGEGMDWGAAAGDLDGDGSLDLVAGLGTLPPSGRVTWLNQMYLNDAPSDSTPFLRLASNFGPGSDETRAIALADMNGDGALDIVAGNYGAKNAIHFGKGEMQPDVQFAPTGKGEVISVAIGDIDGDGRPDIVAGEMTGMVVFTNNHGVFAGSLLDSLDPVAEATRTLILADVMPGGGPEIIVGYGGITQTAVYSRTAAGTWLRHSFGPGDAPVIDIAAGDLDDDGRPDVVLARSGAPNQVCGNGDESPELWRCESLPVLNAAQPADTRSVALADIDGDDSLDIISAVRGNANVVFRNNGYGGFEQGDLRTFGPGDDVSHAVAAGDLNGDYAPDIVVGNFFEPSAVYFNDGKGAFAATPSRLLGDATDRIYDLALVDVDNDGDLDIAAANWGSGATHADVDRPYANALYLNDGAGNFTHHRLDTDRSLGWTQGIAAGDLDGDGLNEIVAGNRYRDRQPLSNHRVIIYRFFPQQSRRLPNGAPYLIIDPPPASDQSGRIPVRYRLFDPDGEALTRVEAFVRAPGDDVWRPAVSTEITASVIQPASKLGVSQVFTLDLAASKLTTQTQDAFLRLLVSPQLPNSSTVRHAYTASTPGPFQYPAVLAGTLLPIRPQSSKVSVAFTRTRADSAGALVYRSADPTQQLLQPLRDPDGDPMQTVADGSLPRRVRLAKDDQLAAVWPSAEPMTYPLVFSRENSINLDTRDQYHCWQQQSAWINQGLFRPRIRVPLTFPTPELAYDLAESTISLPGGHRIHNLKVRVHAMAEKGREETPDVSLELLEPLSETAYRVIQLPSSGLFDEQGIVIDARQLAPDLSDINLQRDWLLRAALRGCGSLQIDWQIAAAVSPLHYTSASPRTDGLNLARVVSPGLPLTLTVDQPLLVFDLDVALEWDARNDANYREQLRRDLLRASQFLYDWTNGQAVLGNVNVYFDARHHPEDGGFQPWLDSDIRIFASNRIRPSASQGGIVTQPYAETLDSGRVITYAPGQVHMGLTWNRYGEQNTLGDDWPRALAHELGHYLFFLEDNYVGYSDGDEKALVSVSGCPGAMADPYRDDPKKGYDEFTANTTWNKKQGEQDKPPCHLTLSAQETGRSDWATITAFYPALKMPEAAPKLQETTSGGDSSDDKDQLCDDTGSTGCLVIEGPTRQVLDLTHVNFVAPSSEANLLGAPILTTVNEAGRALPAGANARVFLFKGGFHQPTEAQLIDLGRPRLDQVFALGAASGDQICVLGGRLQGCAEAGEREITLTPRPEWWPPEIELAPTDATHLAVTVTLPSTLPTGIALCGRLYPLDSDPYTATHRLGASSGGIYTDAYDIQPESPVVEGYLHVWTSDADEMARNSDTGGDSHCLATGNTSVHAVTDFMIGSSAAFRKGTGAFRKGTGAPFRSSQAPVMSGDGQFILYWDKEFQKHEFLTIQTAASISGLPSGAQMVGEAYRLVAVPANLDLSDAFVNFGYLGQDAPPGQEAALAIYHRDEASGEWQPLLTRVDPAQNQASARAQGGGLYALLARLEIPLQSGWNLIGYPLPTPDLAARPSISESLKAIDGSYSIIYGFDPDQPSAPWQVYDPNAAAWANSLKTLEFGRGYLIHVTEPANLSLDGGFEASVAYTTTEPTLFGIESLPPSLNLPPAYYFASLTPTAELTFTEGMSLDAWVDGKRCAQSPLNRIDASDGFTVTIAVPDASAEDASACRGDDKVVEFRLEDAVIGSAAWDNTRLQEIAPVGRGSACRNLLRNGDFEAQGGWTLPSTRIPAHIVAETDLTGNHFLQLGAPPERPAPRRSGHSIAQRTFTVPAQAAGATLAFSYHSGSTAAANESPHLLLLDRRSLRQLAVLSLPPSPEGRWESASIDLSPFGGRSLLLSFDLTYNPRPGEARVWLDVDDVRVCTAP